MLEKREFEQNEFLWRLSTVVFIVSGFFSLIVFLMLLFNYIQIRDADPVDHKLITEMRQQYASSPIKDEALAQRIRDLDLLNRKAFFTTQAHLRTGAILLLIGTSICMIAFKYMMRWRRARPELAETPTHELEFLAFAESRQLLTWAGVAVIGCGMLAALLTESALVETVDGSVLPAAGGEGALAVVDEEAPAQEFTMPTWEESEKQWPAFLGPASRGYAHFTSAPMTWDVESGENIRWKVEAPELHASNSPVIWDDRLYISGADETKAAIYCYDTETGELRWEHVVAKIPGSPADPVEVTEDTGHAAPTMAVHGELAFAIFANGDLIAVDTEGEKVWAKNIGVPDNHYGHSSSLIAYGDVVIVQRDDNAEPKTFAFNAATGEEAWAVEGDGISWASPTIAHTEAGAQLLLNTSAAVAAYAIDSGAELWKVECLGGEVAPSPYYYDGKVFVANEYAVATAIQLTEGAEPEPLWEYDFYLPEVASPIGDGERFYIATSVGELVALDATTGDELWVGEFDAGFYSSPILVGEHIYVADMDGNMYIVKASSEYEIVATIPMGEPVFATPAFMDNRMYVRLPGHLMCIEKSDV